MLTQIKEWILPKEEEKKKDVKLIPIADLHTGGSTALFPYFNGDDLGFPPHPKMTGENGAWRFKQRTYMPTAKQYLLFKHFTKCAETIGQDRGNKRFVVVETGDSIDGEHHHTLQLATQNIGEQVAVHVWLMKYFLHKIGFDKNKGDLLYIGDGTEIHTGDEEDLIAQELGAELLPNGDDTFDFMTMDIMEKRFWFLHQGASAGKGLTKGSALHNWMRNQYFDCLELGRVIPDCVISGHFHRNVHDIFSRNDRDMHGIILPPWQLKTRFSYRVAAAEMEEVGIRTIDIGKDIKVNKPILMRLEDDVVKI